MIEMRYVVKNDGTGTPILQYRYKSVGYEGEIIAIGTWSDWETVPMVAVRQHVYERAEYNSDGYVNSDEI
ncbi:MAG TPA: hypothetical protein VK663_01075 [Burkholderiales bacterium]|nr:hypothetical protein [Burkholderiales bacterium]